MRSYITDGKQLSKSTNVHLTCGIPQGFVLRPLLFVVYIKEVTTIIKRYILLNRCYADDAQMYFYCNPDELNTLGSAFSACTKELCVWMKSNRLKIIISSLLLL